MHDFAVWAFRGASFHGTECLFVEFDGADRVANDQIRRQSVISLGNWFYGHKDSPRREISRSKVYTKEKGANVKRTNVRGNLIGSTGNRVLQSPPLAAASGFAKLAGPRARRPLGRRRDAGATSKRIGSRLLPLLRRGLSSRQRRLPARVTAAARRPVRARGGKCPSALGPSSATSNS